MKRSGFKSKQYDRTKRAVHEPLSAEVQARFKAQPVSEECAPVEKTAAKRNANLLKLAKGQPCMLTLRNCDGGGETTVAAHSNQAKHGKAGARKADDCYSVWSCFSCHSWIDQGSAPREEKDSYFNAAHARQVLAWREIADSYSAKEWKQAAAQWALDQLGEM